MGHELTYQGLPPNSGLLTLARSLALTDPDEAQRLQFLPRLLRSETTRLPGPIQDWCRSALGKFPGIETRNLCIDRTYDKLHFLLSAWRRADDVDERLKQDQTSYDALIAKALGYGAAIDPPIIATQGYPIMWLAPDIVSAIAESLDHILFADIAGHFDSRGMQDAAVYKAFSTKDAEILRDELDWLEKNYVLMRAFFQEAAAAHETVVYWID